MKEVTGSGLFIDLKLACAVHIEYFADLIFLRVVEIKEKQRKGNKIQIMTVILKITLPFL